MSSCLNSIVPRPPLPTSARAASRGLRWLNALRPPANQTSWRATITIRAERRHSILGLLRNPGGIMTFTGRLLYIGFGDTAATLCATNTHFREDYDHSDIRCSTAWRSQRNASAFISRHGPPSMQRMAPAKRKPSAATGNAGPLDQPPPVLPPSAISSMSPGPSAAGWVKRGRCLEPRRRCPRCAVIVSPTLTCWPITSLVCGSDRATA